MVSYRSVGQPTSSHRRLRTGCLSDGFPDKPHGRRDAGNDRSWRKAVVSDLGARLAAPCPHAPAPYRLIRKRRLPGEAAIERLINSPMPERQAFPQAAWSHAQGVGPVADIGLASRAWRSRPRTTLDRPHPRNTLSASLRSEGNGGNVSPARGFPPLMVGGASGAGAWPQPPAAPGLCKGSRNRPSCGRMRAMRPDNLARYEKPLEAQAKRP
jgi:hypothetical protein